MVRVVRVGSSGSSGLEFLGLDVVERSETCITFSGGGGYVTVKCKDQGSSFFDIEVETREWDYHVKEFLSNI